jgi:hypothetical protein
MAHMTRQSFSQRSVSIGGDQLAGAADVPEEAGVLGNYPQLPDPYIIAILAQL